MSFHGTQQTCPVRPAVTVNTVSLMYTAETILLGVYITEKLKWNSHVQSLANN
jgi:hypothetical protein